MWKRRTPIDRRGKAIKVLFCPHPVSPENPQGDGPGGRITTFLRL